MMYRPSMANVSDEALQISLSASNAEVSFNETVRPDFIGAEAVLTTFSTAGNENKILNDESEVSFSQSCSSNLLKASVGGVSLNSSAIFVFRKMTSLAGVTAAVEVTNPARRSKNMRWQRIEFKYV